jgi:hypothetical protein
MKYLKGKSVKPGYVQVNEVLYTSEQFGGNDQENGK